MPTTFSYNRKERLKSRKQLDQLFTKGRSFSVFPVKVFYLPLTDGSDNLVKAGVGVSARNFKKAVQRNRIKRLLRESYRVEKQVLYDFVLQQAKPVAVFFLYIDKVMPEFAVFKQKMPMILEKLIKELNKMPNEVLSSNT